MNMVVILTYNDKGRGAIYASIVATFQMHSGNFKVKHASVRGKIVSEILFARHIKCFCEIRIVVYQPDFISCYVIYFWQWLNVQRKKGSVRHIDIYKRSIFLYTYIFS